MYAKDWLKCQSMILNRTNNCNINPRLKLVQSTTIERKLTFKSSHKIPSPTMMILIIKLSDIDILILKTIMNWKHNIDWNVWIIFFNEAKFEFVKHSKKSFSTFGGYLISTNIHLRKEEGYYDYSLREGKKLCQVVDIRSLTLLLRSHASWLGVRTLPVLRLMIYIC
jgi:hypothetical protein